jgi:hypothetical protein
MTYTQCTLRKYLTETSYIEDVSYIPTKFAVKNKKLLLKYADNDEGWKTPDDEKWSDGWVVHEVYKSSTIDEEIAKRARDEHRKFGTQEIAGRTSRKDL